MRHNNELFFYAFPSDEKLMNAYVSELRLNGIGDDDGARKEIAKSAMKYIPHLYRGGRVIPNFGYSVERVGKYVSASQSGNPKLVSIHGY